MIEANTIPMANVVPTFTGKLCDGPDGEMGIEFTDEVQADLERYLQDLAAWSHVFNQVVQDFAFWLDRKLEANMDEAQQTTDEQDPESCDAARIIGIKNNNGETWKRLHAPDIAFTVFLAEFDYPDTITDFLRAHAEYIYPDLAKLDDWELAS